MIYNILGYDSIQLLSENDNCVPYTELVYCAKECATVTFNTSCPPSTTLSTLTTSSISNTMNINTNTRVSQSSIRLKKGMKSILKPCICDNKYSMLNCEGGNSNYSKNMLLTTRETYCAKDLHKISIYTNDHIYRRKTCFPLGNILSNKIIYKQFVFGYNIKQHHNKYNTSYDYYFLEREDSNHVVKVHNLYSIIYNVTNQNPIHSVDHLIHNLYLNYTNNRMYRICSSPSHHDHLSQSIFCKSNNSYHVYKDYEFIILSLLNININYDASKYHIYMYNYIISRIIDESLCLRRFSNIIILLISQDVCHYIIHGVHNPMYALLKLYGFINIILCYNDIRPTFIQQGIKSVMKMSYKNKKINTQGKGVNMGIGINIGITVDTQSDNTKVYNNSIERIPKMIHIYDGGEIHIVIDNGEYTISIME